MVIYVRVLSTVGNVDASITRMLFEFFTINGFSEAANHTSGTYA